jgi:hypothetical protein
VELIQAIAALTAALAWPIVFLIAIFVFREDIKKILPRIRKAYRKLPQSVDSESWTFLAGFDAGGKSDEEVTIH